MVSEGIILCSNKTGSPPKSLLQPPAAFAVIHHGVTRCDDGGLGGTRDLGPASYHLIWYEADNGDRLADLRSRKIPQFESSVYFCACFVYVCTNFVARSVSQAAAFWHTEVI
jgi:hypothetical protein